MHLSTLQFGICFYHYKHACLILHNNQVIKVDKNKVHVPTRQIKN